MQTKHLYLASRIIVHILCAIFTIGMIINWSLQYTLNEDLSWVKYKNYQATDEDFYPVVSLCFKNHFETDELSKVDMGFNESYLVQLLEGTKYNGQFQNINYDRISHRVEDFVEGIWFRWENGSIKYYNKTVEHDNLFPRSFTGFWRGKFYNCYGMDVPMTVLRKESNVYIEGFSILLNNAIFKNGVRPPYGDFVTFLHYPNQLLLSLPSVKYSWNPRENNRSYNMKYIINGMDILRRRQKDKEMCNENWLNFDESIIEMNLRKVGCRAMYQRKYSHIPLCNNMTSTQRAHFPFRSDEVKKYNPPCKQVDKILYTYEEQHYPDREGTFWVTMLILDSRYKEIVQTR